MKFRLVKAEEGVPFVDIPVGHVGLRTRDGVSISPPWRVLRTRDCGVMLDLSFATGKIEDFRCKYIDLGPFGAEQEPEPKRVPFEDIPVGHVGMAKDGNAYLRMKGGGVSFTEDWRGFIAIEHFNGLLCEDLGKLVVEAE